MSFLLGMAGALASIYIFLFSAASIGDNAENAVLTFMSLFLFLFFGFSVAEDFQSRYFTKGRRK
ncbi:hypothetical protein LCGC14_1775280 [marine sediment metagenome]|uniref:Uncharacterized protein n=1 Tax=marine sediment metagenome TaxID=412755 RepID=A0A0F9JWS7_9ZZZZ